MRRANVMKGKIYMDLDLISALIPRLMCGCSKKGKKESRTDKKEEKKK